MSAAPAYSSVAPRAHLTRRYHLSASHRLCSDAYTDEQNRALYGKCSNPHGHGHNYIAAITFAGPVSPATGMVLDLAALDAFAEANLLAVFDHANLNTLDAFRDLVPTTENFTLEIARIFSRFSADAAISAQLTHVRVEETGNNSFEYSPDPDPRAPAESQIASTKG